MHNINAQRLKKCPTLARISPLLIKLIMILYAMMQPSFNSFYLVILAFSTSLLNAFLKYVIIKPLYKWSGNNNLFLLGSGERPTGATSCNIILDGKKATSFGMPSGHSQIAWTIGIYLVCHLINRLINNFNNNEKNSTPSTVLNNIWICLSIIILFSIMIYISYSRVYIEGCHTIQQVIIGGIIGVILGFLAFYFENDIKKGILGNS